MLIRAAHIEGQTFPGLYLWLDKLTWSTSDFQHVIEYSRQSMQDIVTTAHHHLRSPEYRMKSAAKAH